MYGNESGRVAEWVDVPEGSPSGLVRLAILAGIRVARRIAGPLGRLELRDLEQRLEDTQARLVEADRLALVGTLVAGVAHEVNNPMTYLIANVEYARGEIARLVAEEGRSDLGELTEALDDCWSGTERVRAIMSDLRLIARKGEEDARISVDVRKTLDGAIKIVRGDVRRKATIECAYSEIPAVLANESRLGQVFLNLLVNASQAFPSEAPLNRIRTSTSVDPSGSVVIEVADNGSGIPEALQEKIFDPFFTTKPVGVGTGLGLSISHGIVTSLGGRISVQSTLGEGATFRVVLPAVRPAAGEWCNR